MVHGLKNIPPVTEIGIVLFSLSLNFSNKLVHRKRGQYDQSFSSECIGKQEVNKFKAKREISCEHSCTYDHCKNNKRKHVLYVSSK